MTLHLPYGRTLTCSFRVWLFYRCFLASGRREGDVVPRWLYPLWFLAYPTHLIQRWVGCPHHAPNRDEYLIEGSRFSGIFFATLKGRQLPSPWMRIIKREDGLITWEEQKPKEEP